MGRLVIGMGSGRCGTRSLAEMLNNHSEISCTHEKHILLWMINTIDANKAIEKIFAGSNKEISGDVGYYWLNYTHFLVNKYDAKIVCLKRDKDAVVRSFMKGLQNPVYGNLVMDAIRKQPIPLKYSDYVTEKDLEKMDASTREFVEHYWDEPLLSDNMLREYFPKYKVKDRKSYLERYWEDYYYEAERYRDTYLKNFLLIDIDEALNTHEGIKQIFNFIGVTPVTRHFHVRTNVKMPLMAVSQ